MNYRDPKLGLHWDFGLLESLGILGSLGLLGSLGEPAGAESMTSAFGNNNQ